MKLNGLTDILILRGIREQAKVKALEQEIDRMVYKLYGLTEEEIKIIEGRK